MDSLQDFSFFDCTVYFFALGLWSLNFDALMTDWMCAVNSSECSGQHYLKEM
jgi:hypothetical protein